MGRGASSSAGVASALSALGLSAGLEVVGVLDMLDQGVMAALSRVGVGGGPALECLHDVPCLSQSSSSRAPPNAHLCPIMSTDDSPLNQAALLAKSDPKAAEKILLDLLDSKPGEHSLVESRSRPSPQLTIALQSTRMLSMTRRTRSFV